MLRGALIGLHVGLGIALLINTLTDMWRANRVEEFEWETDPDVDSTDRIDGEYEEGEILAYIYINRN